MNPDWKATLNYETERQKIIQYHMRKIQKGISRNNPHIVARHNNEMNHKLLMLKARYKLLGADVR